MVTLREQTDSAFPRASQVLTVDHVRECVDFDEYLNEAATEPTAFREFFFGPEGPMAKNSSLRAEFADVTFGDPASAGKGGNNAAAARRKVKNAAAEIKLVVREKLREEEEQEGDVEATQGSSSTSSGAVREKEKGRESTPSRQRRGSAATTTFSMESQLAAMTKMLERMEEERTREREEREKEREEIQALYEVVVQRQLRDELNEKVRNWNADIYKSIEKIIILTEGIDLEPSPESDLLKELVLQVKEKLDEMWEVAMKKKKDATKDVKDKATRLSAVCYRCGKAGHYANRCREPAPTTSAPSSGAPSTPAVQGGSSSRG